jgi:flagellar FliL protein
MSTVKSIPEADQKDPAPATASKKRMLILLGVPLVLITIGAGLWFTGLLPSMLGSHKNQERVAQEKKTQPPSYVDLPEMIANLNSAARRPSYIKLSARLEVPKAADVDAIRATLPRVQDLMQTYLREMRPEELRGSAGTYRLREELLARANIAVAPASISDVLFTQMLVQ